MEGGQVIGWRGGWREVGVRWIRLSAGVLMAWEGESQVSATQV